ncbi:MAG: hypothetical protein CMJ65_16290 [Planctomycetaceae bacterium]|nr:hypothetical protein [Planctomycetaceae bacterium]
MRTQRLAATPTPEISSATNPSTTPRTQLRAAVGAAKRASGGIDQVGQQRGEPQATSSQPLSGQVRPGSDSPEKNHRAENSSRSTPAPPPRSILAFTDPSATVVHVKELGKSNIESAVDRDHVVVVGGGLAGLAAATALATQNIPTTLFESRPRLGGRAGSFLDTSRDEWIDHCQHVSLGCCTNLAWLMETVGLDNLFRRDTTLHFVAPPTPGPSPPEIHHLSTGPFPAPLHLLPALFGLKYLGRRHRRELRKGLVALARHRDRADDPPIGEWLARQGQSPMAVSGFWNVILVSALSESLDRISVSHARQVFVSGFLGHRRGWELLVPRVPLEEIYGRRLSEWLDRRGVTIRTGAGVARVEIRDDRPCGVRLKDDSFVAAERVVLAVPHHRVADLLPASLAASPSIARLSELETAPIAAVHAWFDRRFTELPHAVLVDRLGQWMFRREMSGEAGDYVQVVISAAGHLGGRDRSEVIEDVLAELCRIWPAASSAQVLQSRLVIEHRAVISPLPETDSLRPPQQSSLAGLQLAGDWTRTGWPGTMESAVRSGLLAVENLLAQQGIAEPLLQPDLPTGRLARWLLGL